MDLCDVAWAIRCLIAKCVNVLQGLAQKTRKSLKSCSRFCDSCDGLIRTQVRGRAKSPVPGGNRRRDHTRTARQTPIATETGSYHRSQRNGEYLTLSRAANTLPGPPPSEQDPKRVQNYTVQKHIKTAVQTTDLPFLDRRSQISQGAGKLFRHTNPDSTADKGTFEPSAWFVEPRSFQVPEAGASCMVYGLQRQ